MPSPTFLLSDIQDTAFIGVPDWLGYVCVVAKRGMLSHGLALRLHQTMPAVEGIQSAFRLAMGPRNQA